MESAVEDYVSDIHFLNITDEQMLAINNRVIEFLKNKDLIIKSVQGQITDRKEWPACKKECLRVTKSNMKLETDSTAFMLRLLTNSVINAWGTYNKLTFDVRMNVPLTGLWKDDNVHIRMVPLEDGKKSRLIMGFGPSASGKTFWAKHIISLLQSEDFPSSFLAIDGGIAREYSMVYKCITDTIIASFESCPKKKKCTEGFSNLVPAGLSGVITQGIYKDPKKTIEDYLKIQRVVPSLYVPTTASSAKAITKNPANKWNKLVKDDKWISLLIYQHKTGNVCTYPNRFKCVGCTESGKRREKKEGKKYSSTAYDMSMRTGNKWLKQGKGGRFKIHNAGGKTWRGSFNPSVLTEFSVDNDFLFDHKSIMTKIQDINKLINEEWQRINLIYNIGMNTTLLKF